MHNFPSPWRINHAGEVVRDVDVEEVLHKVTPERKSIFSSDADAKKTKGKKESWFRIVRKKDKKGEGSSSFQGIENILDNMQCFSCGPLGESTGDGKKKSRFLSTLTISKKGGKTNEQDAGKSKKENKVKKKEETSASKDKGSKEEQKTKWFQKKKQDDESESTNCDAWSAVMPSSCTAPESDAETDKKDKKDEKDKTQKQNKKTKLQWFRLSNKGKQEKNEPVEEESKGFDLNELSAMITALVNREAEQSKEKGEESGEAATAQAGAEKTDAKEIDHNTDGSFAQWYERFKSEGEGYIRFVTGSDPNEEEDAPATAAVTTNTTKDTSKQEDGSLSGTIHSDGSESTATWATEFSSYEVPSLLQEMKLLTGFGTSKKLRRQSKASKPPQEDEKFLLQKIANDPSSRRNNHLGKDNTLTLQTLDKEGTRRDHGFKVKLHQDRALCEV